MATLSPLSLLLLVFLLSSLPAGRPDLQSDKAALQAFRAAVGRSTLSRWNDSNSPCTWQGITCESGRVSSLRLPGVGLMGAVPTGALGGLTALRTLSLRFNALSGGLPLDLGNLTQLRYLYLQDNRFSGGIPSSVASLQNLVRLNLAGNNFSGGIPASLGNLKRLLTLLLDRNQFVGQIPDFNISFNQFNVSFNHLNGSIPRSLRSQPPSAFMGLQVCGLDSNPCPNEIAPATAPPAASPSGNGAPVGGNNNVTRSRKKKKLSGGAIAGIAVGAVIGVLALLLLLFVFCGKKGGNKTRSLEAGAPKPQEVEVPTREKTTGEGGNGASTAASHAAAASAASVAVAARTGTAAAGAKEPKSGQSKKLVFFGSGPRVFDLEELLRASAEVLGKGTFGTAYKAVLEVGTVVAVKRLRDVDLPEKDFGEKIHAIGAMVHPNLVPLLAYYYSKDEKLLVYDYMSLGSLSALLHGNRGSGRSPLHWETRVSIALAAARGVEYIHSTGPGVSHGNIKSSNILLDKPYNARVSDHGLAHLAGPTTLPNRLSGYRAPEVTDAQKVSQKADVYSFGVLLLELLTGKAPAQALLNEEGVDLPRWVQSVVREEWTSEVFDSELMRHQNAEEDMVELLQLAIDCAAQYPDKRPAMSEVVIRIEEIHRSSAEAGEPDQPRRQHHADPDDQSSRRTHSGDGSGAPTSSSIFE